MAYTRFGRPHCCRLLLLQFITCIRFGDTHTTTISTTTISIYSCYLYHNYNQNMESSGWPDLETLCRPSCTLCIIRVAHMHNTSCTLCTVYNIAMQNAKCKIMENRDTAAMIQKNPTDSQTLAVDPRNIRAPGKEVSHENAGCVLHRGAPQGQVLHSVAQSCTSCTGGTSA